MKLHFSGTYAYHIRILMQKCGYRESAHGSRGEKSYVRVLASGGFPRFHAYLVQTEQGFTVNLHLDQKRPSYGSHTAHSGDYEGDTVEREAARIQNIISRLKR